MKHIIQPRGEGTAYRFNIRTPSALKGMIDPSTGKKFGTCIKRSLGGTRHLPTAKKLRDIRLAEVRAMEADAVRGAALGDRFSMEKASAWAEGLRVQRAEGGPDDCEPDVQDLIEEEVRKAPKARRKAFRKVALSGTLSLADAVKRYLHDRRPGNGNGYAPLRKTTGSDLGVLSDTSASSWRETTIRSSLRTSRLNWCLSSGAIFCPTRHHQERQTGLPWRLSKS